MQINRLFEIIYLLLDRRKMTAKELAERFEVSERTIYRDIDILSSAGIPVYTTKGKGGGIGLLEQFVLNKSLLSEQERKEILYGLQSLCAASVPDAQPVLSRLSSLFQAEDDRWIEVDFTGWGSGPLEKETFHLLRQAILHGRRVSFDYHTAFGQHSLRTVDPARLCFKGQAWYLQGFCLTRQDWRTFKLQRIENLRETGEPAELQRLQQGPPPVDGSPVRPNLEVTLRFQPDIAYRVYDEFDRHTITPQPDGSLLVRALFLEDEWVYGYLLSYAEKVQVLAPDRLRELLKKKLRAALQQYE